MLTTDSMTPPSRLHLDAAREVDRLCDWIRETVAGSLKRRGVVLGLSGGIDSSVVAAVCARALGPDRILGIMMPERDSADDSLTLAEHLAESLRIPTVVENITPLLDGAGCYQRRDAAIQSVIPEYRPNWRSKLVLPPLLQGSRFSLSSVVVQSPDGQQIRARLNLDAYQTIVAATNFKQRCRKMIEYYHADRLRYAVAGTPNLLEYDQGFFVKNGDGAADLKPIAHLYKTQVYQLADYLDVPEIIRQRPPTTDTYSLPQSQEEFFFSVPYQQLDYCLYGLNHGLPPEIVSAETGLTVPQVEWIYGDIQSKRKATRYLHLSPVLASQERTGELTEISL